MDKKGDLTFTTIAVIIIIIAVLVFIIWAWVFGGMEFLKQILGIGQSYASTTPPPVA